MIAKTSGEQLQPIHYIQLNNYMSAALGVNDKDIKIKADAVIKLQNMDKETLIASIASFTTDDDVKQLIRESIGQDFMIGFSNPPLNAVGPIAYSVNPQLEIKSLEKRLNYARTQAARLENDDPRQHIMHQCIKELEKDQLRLDSGVSGLRSRALGAFEIVGNSFFGRTKNLALHKAAVDMVLSSYLPHIIEIGGCQSGKDRYGALVVTADTYKAYVEIYKKLPPAFGSPDFKRLPDEEMKFLNTTFAKHWLSGYRQDVADRNTPGASGLKNNKQILTNDQLKAIREGIVERIREQPSLKKAKKVLGEENTLSREQQAILKAYIEKGNIASIKNAGLLKGVEYLEAFDPKVSHKLSSLNKAKLGKEFMKGLFQDFHQTSFYHLDRSSQQGTITYNPLSLNKQHTANSLSQGHCGLDTRVYNPEKKITP
jgi:hypothetical protein